MKNNIFCADQILLESEIVIHVKFPQSQKLLDLNSNLIGISRDLNQKNLQHQAILETCLIYFQIRKFKYQNKYLVEYNDFFFLKTFKYFNHVVNRSSWMYSLRELKITYVDTHWQENSKLILNSTITVSLNYLIFKQHLPSCCLGHKRRSKGSQHTLRVTLRRW